MKIKVLLLGALLALPGTIAQAQIPISTNTLPPVVGAYDQYYLPGPVDEATGAMTPTGIANPNSAANDILTYVAFDKASKGQSFTTGPNPAGYTISSVTVRHILWTNFLANGTYMNIPSGQTFDFRFGTISGANITSILTTNASYSGSALTMAGGGGTGIYFTFDLSGAGLGTLSPNTTYFFEIASPATAYFELHNTVTNATSYANGIAFYGDTTAALDQSGVVTLPPFGGEFAFVATLTAVGAPSVTATVNPSSDTRGQSFTITATVTPGAGTVTNVNVDLSAIGGSSAASLVLSNGNVYTNTFTVPAGAPLGTASLVVTAKDTTPLTGTAGVVFTVLPSDRVWTGGSLVDNNWSTSANWLGNLAPALVGNNIIFAGVTRLSPNLDTNYGISELVFSNTAGSFTIGSSVASTLTVGSGGIVNNSASAQTLNVPVALAAPQTFNAAAGGLTLNSNLTGGFDLTSTGSGTLTLAGTGTTALGNLRVSNGQLNITGGTVNVSDSQGSSTRIENNATLVVSGGTLNLVGSNVLNGWFPIGVTAGSTGTVVVAGGTINVNDHWGTELGNENGAGVLTINSGTYINNDAGGVGFLFSDGASPGGTVNLNGGSLIVNRIGIGSGAGGNFYFNGGTLKPIASNAGFWNNVPAITASIRAGGAVIDTAGFDVTIGQPLLHSTVPGDVAIDGGLTKVSNGTLTLSGGYNYTGPTRVLGGTLSMNAAMGVPGVAGDLVVSNAALSLDDTSTATLPAGNVMLAGTNAISIAYGALGVNPTTPAITGTGTLAASGTNVINFTGSGFVVGQFPLIKYGSGSLASISAFKLGNLPPGVIGVLVNNTANQSVDFNVQFLGQTLTWSGVTNGVVLGNWDINTDTNWNSASGQAKYHEGDLVTFDDTLFNDGIQIPATNVILTTTLHPSQITMNNNSYPYIFSGPGSLAGSSALILNGLSSVTLTTSNNYTGGTFINAGTLVIANDNQLGTNSGPVTLNGGTLQIGGNTAGTRPISLTAASTLDVVTGATAQLSGSLTGTGDLTLPDFGTVILSPTGTNTLGNLRLSNGQLNITGGAVNVNDSQGSSTRIENNSTLVVSGGTLNILGGATLNGWFPIGVTAGSTGTVVVAGGTINVNDHWGTEVGNESGVGVLTINSGVFINNDAGGIGLLIADGASPSGTINLNGGALIVNRIVAGAGSGGNVYLNGGTLKPIASTGGFWNNSAKVTASVRNGGATVDTAGFNVTIGQPLTHSTVAGDNVIDGGLTKLGIGTLTLNGVSTFTGPTMISGGTLAGTGTIAGALANSATLAPGTGGSGTLTVGGNITLSPGSTSTFAVNGSTLAKSSVATGAGVTYGGALNIVTSGTFTAGQQFQLFSGSGATNTSNFASLIGSPGTGLGFNFTNGVLSVVTVGPTGPAQLAHSFSSGTLSLSWPAGQGWRLQAQTNGLSAGISTNWVYVTDGSVSSVSIPVNPANPTVFYRLAYP